VEDFRPGAFDAVRYWSGQVRLDTKALSHSGVLKGVAH